MMNPGKIMAVCTSESKGTVKATAESITLVEDHGVRGDAHAGPGDRQVSLLEEEKIDLMRAKGLELAPGAFGENIVTAGIDLGGAAVGDLVRIGGDVVLRMTKRGKECHTRCAIYYRTGECIMPVHGVFARVVTGGTIRSGDRVAIEATAAQAGGKEAR